MNSSMTSTTSTLPTPAHSVNGSSVPLDSTHDIVMGEDSPQKRKRSIGDDGDREQKKAHLEQNRLGIEDLHQDVGEKYLLCKTRKAPFTPQDLRLLDASNSPLTLANYCFMGIVKLIVVLF